MTLARTLLRAAFACLLLSAVGPRFASAQQMGLPIEVEVAFKARLHISSSFNPYDFVQLCPGGYYACWDYTNYFNASLNGAVSTSSNPMSSSGVIGSWNQFTEAKAKLRPGKKYTLHVLAQNYGLAYEVDFAPVEGYRVMIGNVQRHRVSGTGSGGQMSATFDVYLEEVGAGAPFGVADSIQSGSKIIWSVGLGSALNGESAGRIQIRQSDFSSALFTPAVLDYESSASGVTIERSGATLQKVRTPRGLAHVVPLTSTSYEIRFYDAGQTTGTGGMTPTGTPTVKYVVERYLADTKLRITKHVVKNDTTTTLKSWYTLLEKNTSNWTLTDWTESGMTPLRKKVYTVNSSGHHFIEVQNGSGAIVTSDREIYQQYSWGWELKQETKNYGNGNNELEVVYEYVALSNSGEVKSITRPDASWIAFDYTTDFASRGLPLRSYEPYLDAPWLASQAAQASGKVVTYSYGADWMGLANQPASITTRTNNIVTAQTDLVYTYPGTVSAWGQNLPLIQVDRKEYTSDGQFLTTTTRSFRADAGAADRFFPGLVHSVSNPDGTKISHAYLKCDVNVAAKTYSYSPYGQGVVEQVFTGTGAAGFGGVLIETVGTPLTGFYDLDDIYVHSGVSTRKDIVRDARGDVCWTAEYVYIGSAWRLLSGSAAQYDKLGNVVRKETFYGATGSAINTFQTYAATYEHGVLKSETDSVGAVTDYVAHDAMGRATRKIQRGYGGVPDVETHYVYDAEGRVVESRIGATAQIISRSFYDKAGRVIRETAPGHNGSANIEIGIDYTYTSGGRTVRKTYPDSGYAEEAFYLDGRFKSLTGTAVVPKYATYALNTASPLTDPESGFGTETTSLNGATAGWTKRTVDWLGRPTQLESPTFNASVTRLATYLYAPLTGQLIKTQTKNNSGVRLLADTFYSYDHHGRLDMQSVDTDNSGIISYAANDRITRFSTEIVDVGGILYRRLQTSSYPNSSQLTLSDKRERLTHLDSTLRGESIAIDANANVLRTELRANVSTRKLSSTTIHPGAANQDLAESVNGQPVYAKSKEGVETTYLYDAWGRQIKVSGRDTMYTTYEYYPGTTQVKRTLDALGETGSWVYDASGRVKSTKVLDDLGFAQESFFTYDARGNLLRQWGSGAQPIEYGYDGYGRQQTMKTYRAGTGWSAATWPTATTGAADTTTWAYQSTTGLLTSKTDAATQAATFTYNSRDQLLKKTWARGVFIDYLYYEPDDANAVCRGTGALKKVDYSDTTPDVEYVYARHGGVSQIKDATGTRSFTYRSADLQPEYEKLDYTFYGGTFSDPAQLSRKYATTGVVGRATGFQFGRQNSVSLHLDQTYGYDATTGRVSSVAALGHTFHYAYKAASNLVGSVTHNAGFDYVRNIAWRLDRSAVDSVETKWGAATKAKYTYQIDKLGRIRTQKFQGSMASNAYSPTGSSTQDAGFGYAYGVQTDYEYSLRNELDFADTYKLDAAGAIQMSAGAPVVVSGRREEYAHDTAQNRAAQNLMGMPYTFQLNNLNQHASLSDSKAVGATYDADGNMTFSGEWLYTYDAENRLVKARQYWKSLQHSVDYDFQYDYLGRMVSRKAPKLVNGLHGQFWNDNSHAEFKGNRVDSNMAFPWSGNTPGLGVDPTTYNARWMGYLEAPADGTYTIKTESDDGVRLFVNGAWRIWDTSMNGYVVNSATVHLKKGAKVLVQLAYQQNVATATLRLKWSGPGIAEQIIPSQYIWTESLNPADVQETRYVYDGWNIIAELDASKVQGATFASCVKQTHVWGLDVTGTTQGAGGIGGLLMTRDAGADYFPVYDGRGNVTGMLDTSGRALAAYEYSAYGELMSAVGSLRDAFHLGWSTKFTEPAMLLTNFGKRWYDPHHGRFINRDPIGEAGGINLYAFLANNPLGGYEYLGMGWLSDLWKSVVNYVKDYVIQVVLAFVPVVGPYLSAAYGAYAGYRRGGAYGAVIGAYGGYKIGMGSASGGYSSISGGDRFDQFIKVVGYVAPLERQRKNQDAVEALDRRIRGVSRGDNVYDSLIFLSREGSQPSIEERFDEFFENLDSSVLLSVQVRAVMESASGDDARSGDPTNMTEAEAYKIMKQAYDLVGKHNPAAQKRLLKAIRSGKIGLGSVYSYSYEVANSATGETRLIPGGGGITNATTPPMLMLVINSETSVGQVASTMLHETYHIGQSSSLSRVEKELPAYRAQFKFEQVTGVSTGVLEQYLDNGSWSDDKFRKVYEANNITAPGGGVWRQTGYIVHINNLPNTTP